MTRVHVFIVNDRTFPFHLEYLFAGTGAREKDEDISLLADICRVREGDLVVFYIEATARVKGGFYGIFKIKREKPLVFRTPYQQGFQPEGLSKKLIYRTLIEPYEVYSKGVPEWEVLDRLPLFATEIQWSLIYRKLKGKRGCTPLFPWEGERLIDLIRNKNQGNLIADNQFDGGLSWNVNDRTITTTIDPQTYNFPRNYDFNVIEHINCLKKKKKAYEVHLQLYFTENIGKNTDLEPIVGQNIFWFGNEVLCGMGMQKIDILTINVVDAKKEYRIIELKDEPITPQVIDQIEYYINWASQENGRHLPCAHNWNIQPVIVAPPLLNSNKREKVLDAFRAFNEKNISLPIKYFEFPLEDEDSSKINFKEIYY